MSDEMDKIRDRIRRSLSGIREMTTEIQGALIQLDRQTSDDPSPENHREEVCVMDDIGLQDED